MKFVVQVFTGHNWNKKKEESEESNIQIELKTKECFPFSSNVFINPLYIQLHKDRRISNKNSSILLYFSKEMHKAREKKYDVGSKMSSNVANLRFFLFK